MTQRLHTRRPTGVVPWPLILIEGGEKSGKSWACAQFSTSSTIGQMYWIDLGEGASDEYGAIPGANYLIVEHDGTWEQIYGSVLAVRDEAQRAATVGDPPIVLVIDSMTSEWDLLKDWASNRARARFNARARKQNQRQLADDDEPKISMDLWNDANGRHRKLMTILMTFPGIVIITARGKEVAMIDEKGNPVPNAHEYRVEGQKSLGYDASCWIRLDRGKPATIIGVRSVHVGIRPGYDDPVRLPRDWSIEGIIFNTLRCDPISAHSRNLADLKPGDDSPESIQYTVLAAAIEDSSTLEDLKSWWVRISPALEDREITQVEADRLTQAVRDRKATLSATQSPENTTPAEVDQAELDKRRREMFALFAEAHMTDRNDQISYLSLLTQREIISRKDLALDEIIRAIAGLRNMIHTNPD